MRKNTPQALPKNPLAMCRQSSFILPSSDSDSQAFSQLFSRPLSMACSSSLFPFPGIYLDPGNTLTFPLTRSLPAGSLRIPLLTHLHSLVSVPKTQKFQRFPKPPPRPGRISEALPTWWSTATTLFQELERAREAKKPNTEKDTGKMTVSSTNCCLTEWLHIKISKQIHTYHPEWNSTPNGSEAST